MNVSSVSHLHDEGIYHQQLAEGSSAQLKCGVNIPALGMAKKLNTHYYKIYYKINHLVYTWNKVTIFCNKVTI